MPEEAILYSSRVGSNAIFIESGEVRYFYCARGRTVIFIVVTESDGHMGHSLWAGNR